MVRKMILLISTITGISMSEAPTAYVVIAAGSKDSSEAYKFYKEYKAKNLPSYRVQSVRITENSVDNPEYPAFMKSDTVAGLNPGYYITVPIICKNKDVAQRLSLYINTRGYQSYLRVIKSDLAKDVKLLQVEACNSDLSAIQNEIPADKYSQISKDNSALIAGAVQRCPNNGDGCGYLTYAQGRSSFSQKNIALIPYVLSKDQGDQIYLELTMNAYLKEKMQYMDYQPYMGNDPGYIKPDTSNIKTVNVGTIGFEEIDHGD